MTTDTLRTLEHIAEKPGTTHRDLLTITRRIVRHFWELRRAIHAERRALRRQASQLRQSDLFTQQRAAALEWQARDHRAEELANVVDVLGGYGRVLVLDREGYARGLGFEELADLLNINRVDRERARRAGWSRLVDLVAIEGLENSAERCGGSWAFHSPLQLACLLTLEFMRTCPSEQLLEARTVGSVRKRPTLVIHDASDSRLVERYPDPVSKLVSTKAAVGRCKSGGARRRLVLIQHEPGSGAQTTGTQAGTHEKGCEPSSCAIARI